MPNIEPQALPAQLTTRFCRTLLPIAKKLCDVQRVSETIASYSLSTFPAFKPGLGRKRNEPVGAEVLEVWQEESDSQY